VKTEPGYVVVGNIASADSALRLGARVVVEWVPGSPDHAQVYGLSRGGRRIRKWVPVNRLKNLRIAWEHKPRWVSFKTREEAEALLARLV
jgi:hypothetical protein